MFLFELFEGQIGCSFVVRHVVVPGAGELKELGALGRFNGDELLLLGLAHVLELTEHLFVLKVFKLKLGATCFRQIHLCAALATVVVQ